VSWDDYKGNCVLGVLNKLGSLGIAVIKNLLNTDYMDGHGSLGFLKDFSVRFREIRPIRVQNRGNPWRAIKWCWHLSKVRYENRDVPKVKNLFSLCVHREARKALVS
jgi:hypothetical protein